MTSVREAIRRLFAPPQPLPAGSYHYQAPPNAPRPYRLHLRLETDGSGLLIVNAATVLHLNRTAAEYAYHLVQRTPEEEAARQIARRYRVGWQKALQDLRDISQRIQTLIETPDLDPETFLGFDRTDPYSARLSAPLRLDCALTYRLPPGVAADLAPMKRVERELSTDEWKTIIQKAYQAGIPHLIFTGGEPTLREDLPDLIAYAEANGQVTGLLSDGLRLADANYLNLLLQTGLDHLMLLLQTRDQQAWRGLQNALAADLFVAVHLTVTPENETEIADQLACLAEIGVKSISLSASTIALQARLAELRDLATERGLSLVWDLPVPYSAFNPVAFETREAFLPEGAGRAWLYVEPDGDVLPAQGASQVMGNLLRDAWESIWRPD